MINILPLRRFAPNIRVTDGMFASLNVNRQKKNESERSFFEF